MNLSVLDGVDWELDAVIGGSKIRYAASNAYPDSKTYKYGKTFKAFLSAIEGLVGEPLDLERASRRAP